MPSSAVGAGSFGIVGDDHGGLVRSGYAAIRPVIRKTLNLGDSSRSVCPSFSNTYLFAMSIVDRLIGTTVTTWATTGMVRYGNSTPVTKNEGSGVRSAVGFRGRSKSRMPLRLDTIGRRVIASRLRCQAGSSPTGTVMRVDPQAPGSSRSSTSVRNSGRMKRIMMP